MTFRQFLGRLVRPLVWLYCWWFTLRLGRFGEAVVVPDTMAIGMGVVVTMLLMPFVLGPYFVALLLAVLCPFVLTAMLWISRGGARVVRFFFIVPYWVQRVPPEAKLELYQAWEDPAPSSVAFTWRRRRNRELHLGTVPSAPALHREISGMLERAGWKP